MKSNLGELFELALESPRRALVEAWFWATGGALDSAEFQNLSQSEIALADRSTPVESILRALAAGAVENCSLEALAHQLPTSPLAWLVALDRYAFEEVPAFGEPQWIVRPQLALSGAPPSDEGAFIVRRRQWPLNDEIAHARQHGHIQYWLRCHWISPASVNGRAIRVLGMPPALTRKGMTIATARTLRVAVVSLDDGATLDWQAHGNAMLARGVVGSEARGAALRAAVAAAGDADVDVLVAPELTISESLRHDLVDHLREFPNHSLWLMTPGSFHESRPGAAGSLANRNTARLLDVDGRELARHDKLRPYSWMQRGVQHIEAIEAGHEVVLLETPIGHVAMAICLDHCEESAGFQTLWEWAAPDLLLAPTMDAAKHLEPYARAADHAARAHGCCSVVANQPPEGDATEPPARGLVRARAGLLNPVARPQLTGCQVLIYDVVLGPSC